MIPVERITYNIEAVRVKGAPVAFRATASLDQPSAIADAAPVVVSADAVGPDKDAARAAAQKALLVKLVGAAVSKPPSAPSVKPKE